MTDDLLKGMNLGKQKNKVEALIQLLDKSNIETKTILTSNQIKSICYARFKAMCKSSDKSIRKLTVYEKWEKIVDEFLVLSTSLKGWRSNQVIEGLGRIEEEESEKPMVSITGQKK